MLYNTLFAHHSTGIAIRDQQEEISYPQFRNRIMAIAESLRKAASNRHFRVLCCEAPSICVCAAILAIIKAGGMVFMYQPQAGSISEAAKHYEADIILITDSLSCEHAYVCSASSLSSAAPQLPCTRFYRYDLSDVCMGFFTSGTSGQSKCVLLTQSNLASNVIAGCSVLTYSPEDVHLLVLPLYHAFGMTCSLLAVLYSGGCLCIGGGPARILDDLKRYRPTFLQAVPIMVKMLLALSRTYRTNIRKILCGGAHTDPELILSFRKLGVDVYSCYGLTECSPCVSCNDLALGKEHTSGRLLSCNEIQFCNGEILLSGSNIMYGYYGAPRQSVWLHTGDYGYLDDDGYLCIIGRKDNIIKCPSGEKMHPEIIEIMLTERFSINECIVHMTDNRIVASVYTQDSAFSSAEALAWLRQNLPQGYQIDGIDLRNTPFPKNKLMKIIRGHIL